MSPLRLGVVSYLNAAPTVHGLAGDSRFQITRDVPSRIAARLHAGEIDLGLIPLADVKELIALKPLTTELVLTGRGAHVEVIALADLVTEMREIKHYYNAGQTARVGIES